MNKIRIGTRGSKLALRQAALVQEALQQVHKGIETEIVILRTKGDNIQDKPLSEIGEKGVFASELEQALLREEIEIAVHSAKDLPMNLAEGLTIAAVLPRADVRDVLVIPKGGRLPIPEEGREQAEWVCDLYTDDSDYAPEGITLQNKNRSKPEGIALQDKNGSKLEGTASQDKNGSKPEGIASQDEDRNIPEKENRQSVFVIGSGSRRRQIQALHFWDHVKCEGIRGNVDTRLRKLQEGTYDGILLAKAGLDRLGIGSGNESEFVFCALSPEQFLPAACQGIIAVEARTDTIAEMLCGKITDKETELCFLVERETLAQLSADCSEAAAAWCRQENGRLVLDAMYAGNRARLISQDVFWPVPGRVGDRIGSRGKEAFRLIPDAVEDGTGSGKQAVPRQRAAGSEDNIADRTYETTYEAKEDIIWAAELQEGLQMARRAAELVKEQE